MTSPKRIGYCLFVHKNPEQVRRLIDRIYDVNDVYHITVFCNRAKEGEWEAKLPMDRGNVHVAYMRSGAHSTFLQVAATLQAMRFLKNRDIDHMIMLSGQCYPLMTREEIKNNLDVDRSYFKYRSEPEFGPAIRNRFKYCYIRVPNPNLIRKIFGRKATDRNIFIKFPRMSDGPPGGMAPYMGTNWLILKKEHLNYILDFVEENPRYMRYFRNFISADESFFHIILLNSIFRDEIVNEGRTYVDWTDRGSQLPNFLISDDLDAIMSSGCLFARKFDADIDEKVLDSIDEMRLNTKGQSEHT